MHHLECRFFLGIDRGVQTPHCCVVDTDGKILAHRSVEHTAEGIVGFILWLSTLTHGELHQVAAAAEAPHGALIEALIDRGVALFSINPKQLDRLRQAIPTPT